MPVGEMGHQFEAEIILAESGVEALVRQEDDRVAEDRVCRQSQRGTALGPGNARITAQPSKPLLIQRRGRGAGCEKSRSAGILAGSPGSQPSVSVQKRCALAEASSVPLTERTDASRARRAGPPHRYSPRSYAALAPSARQS